jgi:hypothetical protein
MKHPRPNEPILVENDGHLRHYRRAWKYFVDAFSVLILNKQTITTNEVETKSFARVSSNLLSADVEAMRHERVERHWIEHGGRDSDERG